MSTPRIGSHVERANPLEGAALRNADVIQINLSAPQQWRAPKLRGDEESLANADIPIFVHAPYLVNAASIRPEQRDKSRQCLIEQLEAAANISAAGLVVHGGHPTGDGTIEDGIEGWLQVLDGLQNPGCRLLIENTAGGSNAVARHVDALDRLFTSLRNEGHEVGFVLDTCHAHAGMEDTSELITQIRQAVGAIDLVHLNDSKDTCNSGRDRHQNLGEGLIDPAMLIEVAAKADAPVVVETPGGAESQAADIEWVRERI